MDRRALPLATAALAVALLLAGCSAGGSTAPGYEDLTVEDFDVTEGEDGSLVVAATVANTATEARSGTLYVNVETNGTTNTRVRQVEVEPAGTTDVEVEFDASYEAFNDGGSLTFDFDEA